MQSKIITRNESIRLAKDLKKKGKKIITTNGSFDILHAGHIRFLKEAKKQGDVLFLGLNSDKSIRAWKKHIGYKDWKKRPLVPQQFRAEMIAALECVDYVTIFDEMVPIPFIEAIKPNVHVNGEDYGKDCIEKQIVEKYGGKIYIVKNLGGFSTSRLIERILDVYGKA